MFAIAYSKVGMTAFNLKTALLVERYRGFILREHEQLEPCQSGQNICRRDKYPEESSSIASTMEFLLDADADKTRMALSAPKWIKTRKAGDRPALQADDLEVAVLVVFEPIGNGIH